MLPLCIFQQQTTVVTGGQSQNNQAHEIRRQRKTNCTNEKKETWVSGTLICHILPQDANLKPTNVNENVIVIHLRIDGRFFYRGCGPCLVPFLSTDWSKKIRG